MYKKFLCVILSVAMLISMVTLPGFAAGAADLSAGYVSYTDMNDAPITSLSANAAVKASTTISNAGDMSANAVVWTATYDNGVLVSTAYSAVSVPAGGSVPVSVTTQAMPADVSNVVLYTYIWDSFTNMNSIAPVATFPSSNADLASAALNGAAVEFDITDKAGVAMTQADYDAGVSVTAVAADNSTKVEISEPTGFPGSVTITATASDGTERTYTLNIKEKFTASGSTNVYDVPTRESIGTQVKITPNAARPVTNTEFKEIKPHEPVADDSAFYSDRLETMKFVTTGSELLGATPILLPLNDARSDATDFVAGQNDYFYVTANEPGTVFVKFTQDMPMFEADKSWTKVTEVGSTPPNYNSAEWWGNGGKAPDSYTYNPDAFPYYCNMIQYDSANEVCYLSTYTVTYYKHFEAGEEITVYTPSASTSQNIVTLIQWDEEPPVYPEIDVTLKSLTYNGISVPGFDPEKTSYSVMVDESVSLDTIEVVGVANNENPEDNVQVEVTKGEVADNKLTVTVRVYAEDGTEKTYTINFMQVEPNKIYNLTTASAQGVYTENGGYNPNKDTEVGGLGNSAPMGIEDDIQDGTTFVYSDRSNRTLDSRGTLEGATIIRRSKGESAPLKFTNNPDGTVTITEGSLGRPYYSADFVDSNGGKTWVSFMVSSDAIVYMSDPIGAGWPNKTEGWALTTESSDPSINTVYLNQARVWYKEYKAGDIVEIPSYGPPATWTETKGECWDPPVYVVQWKESEPVGPSANTDLATLSYDGSSIPVVAGQSTYNVTLPEAKTVTLTWTLADDGATSVPASGVEVVVPEAGASQSFTVTAEDGTTQATYTVNFTVEAIDVEPNTVYDLTYASDKAYALQTMKRSTPESVKDGTAEPTWMYSTYVGLTKGETDEDGNYKWNTSDGYSQSWAIFQTDNVSPYFEGMTVIAMDKGEANNPTSGMNFFTGAYDGQGDNPYWLTFRVSSPATVYYKDTPNAGWFNKPDDWKYVPSEANLHILSTSAGAKLFYKHYNAGDLVQIPNYGFSEDWKPGVDRKATEPGGYFIVWDDLLPYEVTISGGDNVTAGTPVTLSAALSKTSDDSAVEGATFNWVITDGTDKATIDQATGVLTPTAAGTITVAAAATDGTAIGYQDITIGEAVGPVEPAITSLTPNPARPIQGPIKYEGENIGTADVNNLFYTDRSNLTFGHVSSALKGSDTIILPRDDVYVKADNEQLDAQAEFMQGNNEYFNFTGNHEGTVYVLSHRELPNYTEANGWTTLNNGTGITLPCEVDGQTYEDLKTLPFTYAPEEPKYYATRVQWFYKLQRPEDWLQDTPFTDGEGVEKSRVEETLALSYVYAKTFDANEAVSVLTPGFAAASNFPHNFTVLVKWEKDTLVSVLPDISGGIDEGGEYKTLTAASVEVAANAAGFTITAAQDPTSAKITVEGTSSSAVGTAVPVIIYQPGQTPADADAAVAAGESLDTIIAGVAQTTVKKNNTYSVEIMLNEAMDSGMVEIWAADGTNKDKVTLDFVNPVSRLAAMKAIIDAANLTGEEMPAALAQAITDNLAEIEGNITLFNSLSQAGKEFVAEYAAPKIKDIDETDISKYAEVAAPIDDGAILAALSEGLLTQDNIDIALEKLGGSDIADKAVSTYKNGINEDGKDAVLQGMKKSTYYSSWSEAQAAFLEEVVVNAISNPTSARTALESINTFKDITQLSECNWTSFNSLVSAGKGTQFAINLTNEKPTSYTDYIEKFNKVASSMTSGGTTTPGGGPGTPGSGNNNSNTPGDGTIIVNPPDPSTDEGKSIDDFTDANEAVWAKPALQTMLDKNIFAGYEDNTIRPNDNATREEVIKILVSTFFTVDNGAVCSFSDVEAGSWYYPFVATGEAKGITKGMGDGTFGVGQNVTRQDFAVMIYNYLLDQGYAVNTTPYEFVDNDAIADYARDAIYALKNADIIKGYEDKTVAPEGSATRAEIAQMVANLIVLLGL